MRYYIDTSAFVKIFIEEAESDSLKLLLDELETKGNSIISSSLIETEARRVAFRNCVEQNLVTELLSQILILNVTRADFRRAGILVSGNTDNDIRSLDAIHLAVAESNVIDGFITYDRNQAEVARSLGFEVKGIEI